MRDKRVVITAYPNGPFLVRGLREIAGEDGEVIEVDRPVAALCRCGRSRLLPLCDGTHKRIGFKAPGSPWLGGTQPTTQLGGAGGGAEDAPVGIADAASEPAVDR
jgi:CDGSH-type Zn-finger protein